MSIWPTNTQLAPRRSGGSARGAALRVVEDDCRAVLEKDAEELVQLLDERIDNFGTLTDPYGTAADIKVAAEVNGDRPIHVIGLAPNTSRAEAADLQELAGIRFPGPPNYLPVPIRIDELHSTLRQFEDDVIAVAGATPDALVACIGANSLKLIKGLQRSSVSWAQVMRTGYMPITHAKYEDFVTDLALWFRDWWMAVQEERLDNQTALDQTRAALTALTYSEQDLAGISLWDRLPFKLVLEGSELNFVDYSALPVVLAELFRQIGFLDGEPANVKAANFEDVVGRVLGNAGFEVWEKGKDLVAEDGSRRQVDISVVVNDMLLVVECKAFSQNPRIDRGDFAAFKGRRETLETYLGQARTLADFIDQNRTGRNYAVPANVAKVDYCLSTPGIEWIWSRAEGLWITEKIPRICCPDELVEALSQFA